MRPKIIFSQWIYALIMLLSTNVALATTSEEYAAIGKASWSAFECAIYAEKSNNPKEQERLFIYAYERGKEFIEAVKTNKIKREDISKGVPLYMPMLLGGPSTDFMLGRIYEFVANLTYEKFEKSDNKDTASLAKNMFWNQNCELIGK